MRIVRHLALVASALAVAALAGAYWYAPAQPEPELDFRMRVFPPGTRDLVLDQGQSAFNTALTPREIKRIDEQFRPDPTRVCRALFRDVSSPSQGAPDHPVQIITFLDYRCPYCKTLSNILSTMDGENVRLVFREWPILGDASLLAARAALAADRQGRYLAFHNRLMNMRLVPTPAVIDSLAGELGMDVEKLRTDMNADTISQALQRNAAMASMLGLSGTPAMIVGRTVVKGEITRRQLEKLVADEQRNGPMTDC